ncbi:MAG: RluA family pseudouridine synthase [Nitrospinae bacterium]|nr:RluA family pseudouridine synthase [Nitrospinota bacterium]
MTEERLLLTVPDDAEPLRLDRFVADFSGLSRARGERLIEEGAVTVNGMVVTKPSAKVSPGMVVDVNVPPTKPSTLTPEAIPLTIVYEDDQLMVIDKPAGMVVHPSAGHEAGTLVHAILSHCGDHLSGVGGVARPGIVHRLDRETSGLIMVAKTDDAHRGLAAQLKSRQLSRSYLAVVRGTPKNEAGEINAPIDRDPKERKRMAVVADGRPALSRYKVLLPLKGASVVRVELSTGRTHQVRVHLKHIGHPVLGDVLYSKAGEKDRIDRQALHAWKLTFIHPATGETMSFTAPLPDDMARLIQHLGGDPAFFLSQD